MIKTGIIIISFGSCDKDVRERSTGMLRREAQKVFPDALAAEYYTSLRMREAIRKAGQEALELDEIKAQFKKANVENVIFQPAFLMKGGEYENIRACAEAFKKDFKQVSLGEPLTGENSCEKLAEAISSIVKKDKITVFAGHGSIHEANKVYYDLQKALDEKGFDNVIIGTFEAQPDINYVLEKLEEKNCKEVVLMPLLTSFGSHAVKDIFGEKDSYLASLENAGYKVEPVRKGLCEYPEIRKIWLNSIENFK